MKNFLKVFIAALTLASIISCSTTGPVNATSNPIGKKVGEAKYGVILGIFPLGGGDASIAKAAKNGGITKISTVDSKIIMPASPVFAIFYFEVSTIVTGE